MSTRHPFQKALTLHRAGRVAEAQQMYHSIGVDDPTYPKALHHLGILALQNGDYAEAAEQIGRALDISSNQPLAHTNRAAALNALRRHDEALAHLDQAEMLKPDDIEILTARGKALMSLGRYAEAITNFDRVIVLRADHGPTDLTTPIAAALMKP
jgi:tetratricopeptide (TPR) repeat protein